jgi:1-acyl-sn-glycerol-3-phosphate acyltransferase
VTPPAAYDGGNRLVWAVCIRVLDLGLRLLGAVRVRGGEHVPRTGAALLAANHVSHLDPVVLLLVAHRCGRKVRIMGVQEVHDRPLVGRFVRAGRHIPVVQGSPSRAPLLAAEQALAAGELVLVYPEGTIPEPGAQVAAKGGVGLLTSRARVPVVPLCADGLAAVAAAVRHRRRRAAGRAARRGAPARLGPLRRAR